MPNQEFQNFIPQYDIDPYWFAEMQGKKKQASTPVNKSSDKPTSQNLVMLDEAEYEPSVFDIKF